MVVSNTNKPAPEPGNEAKDTEEGRPAQEGLPKDDDEEEEYIHPASDLLFGAVAALAHMHEEAGGMAHAVMATVLHAATEDPLEDYPERNPADVPESAMAVAAPLVKCSLKRLRDRAVTTVRKLVSREQEPPLQATIDLGICTEVTRYLRPRYDQSTVQFDSLWLLTNVASGTTEHTKYILELPGLMPNTVRLLKAGSVDSREQAAWMVGNIAGDSATFRDVVNSHGALPAVAELACDATQKVTVTRNATWAMSNMCRGKPTPAASTYNEALPAVTTLLSHADDEVAADAAWCLNYITDIDDVARDRVLEDSDMMPRVFAAMQRCDQLLTPCLRTVGNMCSGTAQQTSVVVQQGLMQSMPFLLGHAKRAVAKEAAWTLSNILADDPKYVSMMLALNVFPSVLNAATNAPHEVRKEAAWCLANACEAASDVDIQGMLAAGIVPAYNGLLQVIDLKIVRIAMEGVNYLLEKETEDAIKAIKETQGMLEAIESLQSHQNEEVYHMATQMLETYFAGADDAVDAQQETGDNKAEGFTFL